MTRLLGVASAVAFLAFVASAHAQSRNGAAPDVVRLKDGSMLRGTIVTRVANVSLSIALPNGETRTYALSETDYAGPASADPSLAVGPGTAGEIAPASLAAVNANVAHVNLIGAEPDLTFHLQTGENRRLCTAPCTADVPVGENRFALSRPDGDPQPSDHDVDLHGGETVKGTIENRSGLRTGGIVLIVVGGVAGLAGVFVGELYLVVNSELGGNDSNRNIGIGLLAGGLAVIAATVTPGVMMVVAGRDRATVRVVPGVASLTLPRWAAREGISAPAGFSAVVAF